MEKWKKTIIRAKSNWFKLLLSFTRDSYDVHAGSLDVDKM